MKKKKGKEKSSIETTAQKCKYESTKNVIPLTSKHKITLDS